MKRIVDNFLRYNEHLEAIANQDKDVPRWTEDWRILFNERDMWSFFPTPFKHRNQNFNALSRLVMVYSLYGAWRQSSYESLVLGGAALLGASYLFPSLDVNQPNGSELGVTDPAYTKDADELETERKMRRDERIAAAQQQTQDRFARDVTNDRNEIPAQMERFTGTIDELADASKPRLAGDTSLSRQLIDARAVGPEAIARTHDKKGSRHPRGATQLDTRGLYQAVSLP